jgi:hypothetical protein
MGKNAPVLIPIMAPLASPINGMAKLSDAEVAAFRTGNVYVNIHTKEHSDGEIRGQMERRRK